MDGIELKTIDQIEAYSGPHEIPGIRFRHARKQLGVNAWGMNIIQLYAHCAGYPEHDHLEDGQQEVYVVLQGELVLLAHGQELPLPQGALVRVEPHVKRKLVTREHAATVLALGATPGKAYKVEAF